MVIGTSGPKAQAHTVNRSINTTMVRSKPSSTGHEWATSLGVARERGTDKDGSLIWDSPVVLISGQEEIPRCQSLLVLTWSRYYIGCYNQLLLE